MKIIIHTTPSGDKYFFSTDHCQEPRSKKTYPKDFVPCTAYLPMSVVARPSLPSGRIETLDEYLMIFFPDGQEIPNPDPKFQPK